jgi:hypothetical protein
MEHMIKIPGQLQIEPTELRFHAKKPFKAERCIGRNPPLATD